MRTLIAALAVLTLAATASAATLDFVQLSAQPGDYSQCAVAISGAGDIVAAWEEAGVGVWTRRWVAGSLEDPVFHGPGIDPGVCWTTFGFSLVWADGDRTLTRELTNESWGPVVTVRDDPADRQVLSLAVASWQPCWQGSENALALEMDDVSALLYEGWGGDFSGGYAFPSEGDAFTRLHPQAQWACWSDVCAPRLYVANPSQGRIDYFDMYGYPYAVWPDDGYFGGEFDTAIGPYGQHLVGVKPQPACPCNHLYYCTEIGEGTWTEPEELTVDEQGDDWPRWPALAVDADGAAHVFWFQQFEYAAESSYASYYKVKAPGGQWEDRSELLGGRICRQGDLALGLDGQVALVFELGDPEPTGEIWLGRGDVATAVDTAPAAITGLSVHPNPFNPSAEIRFSLPAAEQVAVTVHDAAGRQVARLLDAPLPAGAQQLRWEGRDDAGDPMSTGVYLIRVQAGGTMLAQKAVLLK